MTSSILITKSKYPQNAHKKLFFSFCFVFTAVTAVVVAALHVYFLRRSCAIFSLINQQMLALSLRQVSDNPIVEKFDRVWLEPFLVVPTFEPQNWIELWSLWNSTSPDKLQLEIRRKNELATAGVPRDRQRQREAAQVAASQQQRRQSGWHLCEA